MFANTIKNPLRIAKLVGKLIEELRQFDLQIHYNDSIAEFDATKRRLRNKPATPMFDGQVCDLPPDRFLWMKITRQNGEIAGLQAFRCDAVHPHLAEWASQTIIGIYARRNELLAPAHINPPNGSIAYRLSGKLSYHGELWIDPKVRSRRILDAFTRCGMLIATLKWQPTAIWALTSKAMASHGHPLRMGYSHVESGFLRWTWAPEDNPLLEYLIVSDLASIEHWTDDMWRDYSSL
jgi:hypothetical protein